MLVILSAEKEIGKECRLQLTENYSIYNSDLEKVKIIKGFTIKKNLTNDLRNKRPMRYDNATSNWTYRVVDINSLGKKSINLNCRSDGYTNNSDIVTSFNYNFSSTKSILILTLYEKFILDIEIIKESAQDSVLLYNLLIAGVKFYSIATHGDGFNLVFDNVICNNTILCFELYITYANEQPRRSLIGNIEFKNNIISIDNKEFITMIKMEDFILARMLNTVPDLIRDRMRGF